MFRVLRRQLTYSRRLWDASVFKMPAMSPTMTEGGIVSWKVAPGDKFSAGDVLLEVETDKATIDVEAQDDGQMFDILKKDGDKGIPVGAPIAFLAEPEDDLKTLERPQVEEEAPPKKEAKETAPEESKKAEAPKESPSEATNNNGTGKANPDQIFPPSVQMLLHENHIERDVALEKIPASGPKGRILKGDVLAYLGDIPAEAPGRLAAFLNARAHLDLSNIKVAKAGKEEASSESASKENAKEGKEDAAPAPKPRSSPIKKLQISFTAAVPVEVDNFEHNVSRAVRHATVLAHSAAFPEYAVSPVGTPVSQETAFDELLVAAPSVDRFTVSGLSFNYGATPAVGDSLFDELVGAGPVVVSKHSSEAPTTAQVSLSLSYDSNLTDAKQAVDIFADALLQQVPSNDLVVVAA
ncbi:pyruvate dehydrogenase complex protein X component, mitochondrial [Diutina catenulata]